MQLFEAVSRTPHAAAPECGGGDFWLHNQPPEVDITTAAVTPDAWMACDVPCKLQWARSWIRSHLRDAVRLQKPLLLAPIAALRPHAWRAALLGLVRDEVARALEHGHPIAGVCACAPSVDSTARSRGPCLATLACGLCLPVVG
jgi:hypothetical protein